MATILQDDLSSLAINTAIFRPRRNFIVVDSGYDKEFLRIEPYTKVGVNGTPTQNIILVEKAQSVWGKKEKV